MKIVMQVKKHGAGLTISGPAYGLGLTPAQVREAVRQAHDRVQAQEWWREGAPSQEVEITVEV